MALSLTLETMHCVDTLAVQWLYTAVVSCHLGICGLKQPILVAGWVACYLILTPLGL